MKPEDGHILGEVLCKVLEREAFMFAQPADKKSFTVPRGELLRSAIRFSGNNIAGVILISLQVDLAREIAANILGEDSDDEVAISQANDAFGEILNVLCGQFITTVEGAEPIFDLSVPRVGPANKDDWSKIYNRPSSIPLMVDDQFSVLVDLDVKQIG